MDVRRFFEKKKKWRKVRPKFDFELSRVIFAFRTGIFGTQARVHAASRLRGLFAMLF